MVEALRYKLCMFGIPINGPCCVFCNNEAVYKNMVLPESTTMLNTANATQARPLFHIRTLGRLVAAATIGQARYARQCAKNKKLSLTKGNQVTHSKMYLSYRQLAKGWGVGKTNTTIKQLKELS